MIIKAFATYLQSYDEDIPSTVLLVNWIRKILDKEATNNVERVIQHEINISKNNMGMFMLTGKGKSGQNLIEALYSFAMSYDQQKFARWIHNTKASDFDEKGL
jgi:hypothetical protein